jgi:uncharacterized protein (TIGR02722 family)
MKITGPEGENTMKKGLRIIPVCLAALAFFAACSSNPKVTRVAADTMTDLSGYWNDTDLRIVSEGLIADCLTSPLVARVQAQKGRLPVIIVGTFRNGSDEHLDTEILSSRLEVAILRSGKAEFVASGDLRSEIRAERADQQTGYTSDETAAALGKELGADFILTGVVKTMIDGAGKTSTRTYFVTAELTDIETNRRSWIGENNEIKKVIKTPGVKL